MRIRPSVRALVEADDGSVLLIRIVEPGTGRSFWITPGGGIEEAEDDFTALRRELYEETGFLLESRSELIWTRDFTFSWDGETLRQLERFYWVKCPKFEPVSDGLLEYEVPSFGGLRWWSVEEIEASDEVFAPLDLATQIRNLREIGLPESPVTLGA